VRTIGIIGMSEGNGHPFSYSSIINGYSEEGLAASGWPGIHDYVRRRHASEFGLGDWSVTHAWTQDPATTARLCAACRIAHAAGDQREFLGAVDAVIIARDDFENHFAMARPFLEAGLPVFVDKPLALDPAELRFYRPYLESGRLMSCSGMRYARELDEPRANLAAYGRVQLIRGAIVLSWEKYGVHLLDAILAMLPAHPVSVRMNPAGHASAVIRLDDGLLVQIDALGECARTFHVEIFGTQRAAAFDITDNFSMFRRMLWQFVESIRMGRPAIPPERTIETMQVLIAGRIARRENREVSSPAPLASSASDSRAGSRNSARTSPWSTSMRRDAPRSRTNCGATTASEPSGSAATSRTRDRWPPWSRAWSGNSARSTSCTTTPPRNPRTSTRSSPPSNGTRSRNGGGSCR